jgi:hypothetical protein
VETPDPSILPREKISAVSLKAAEPKPHATANVSICRGLPAKGTVSPQQWDQLMDVMRWRNPAVSALVFLIGTFIALAVEFILRGAHNVTPLKGVLACLALGIWCFCTPEC